MFCAVFFLILAHLLETLQSGNNPFFANNRVPFLNVCLHLGRAALRSASHGEAAPAAERTRDAVLPGDIFPSRVNFRTLPSLIFFKTCLAVSLSVVRISRMAEGSAFKMFSFIQIFHLMEMVKQAHQAVDPPK